MNKIFKTLIYTFNVILIILTAIFIMNCIYINHYPKLEIAICIIIMFNSIEKIIDNYYYEK